MTKLHKVLAVERDLKREADRRITVLYQNLNKDALTRGLTRSYAAKNEGGDQLPSESTLVQINTTTALKDISAELGSLWDLTATKDYGNMDAVADVMVDDEVLIEGAPAPYLLWLEKQLIHVHTIVSKLPILDPAETWAYDDSRGCYVSTPQQTNRTKKVPKVLVKAPATDKHQADTEVYYEDVTEGTWTVQKFSGGITADDQRAMLDRVNAFTAAVKVARSTANEVDVVQRQIAGPALRYIFGG